MATALSQSDSEPGPADTTRITLRGVVLGVLSIAGMSLYITHFGGALIKSYLPVAIMVPFLMWVVGNCCITRFRISFELSLSYEAAQGILGIR